MKDDIVIVGAVRTPVGAFNGAFASLPAHDLGKVAIKAAIDRAGVEPARVSEVILGQILQAGQGQGPGAPGFDQCRHPGRGPGLERQPAVRLGAARGGARLSGHRQRRFRDRGRRRPGVDEHGAALRPSAQRREDGQLRDGRHHDQGRPLGRLQRLPHGQYRRERRPPVADHAAAAGRVRGRFAEEGRGGAEGRQVQGRDRPGHHQEPQGRHRRRRRRIPQARHDARGGGQAAARLRQGRHRHRRERLRHQ